MFQALTVYLHGVYPTVIRGVSTVTLLHLLCTELRTGIWTDFPATSDNFEQVLHTGGQAVRRVNNFWQRISERQSNTLFHSSSHVQGCFDSRSLRLLQSHFWWFSKYYKPTRCSPHFTGEKASNYANHGVDLNEVHPVHTGCSKDRRRKRSINILMRHVDMIMQCGIWYKCITNKIHNFFCFNEQVSCSIIILIIFKMRFSSVGRASNYFAYPSAPIYTYVHVC